jgi:RNA polymerase sigma-70 factor (ECF subfamily)
MSKETIIDLIQKSKRKDLGAFRKLVEDHQFMVYKLAFRLLANEEDAKDMTQEVFIRVWEKLDLFDTRFSFSSWVYKITTNMCFDLLKSTKYKQNKQMVELQNQEITADSIEGNLTNNELAGIIHSLTNELSPKQKLVFTLSDIEALETKEISDITGLSSAKIKSNLYLARQYIRTRMGKIIK